jgi:4-hydroxy-tetrahydrodipicolinate synthase
MAIFKGAGVAIATPFKENGEVNYEEFERLIEFQIENGTDAIIVCGTTGEAATMTEEEHMDVVKYCIDKVAKRVPVIAGTGSNDTEYSVRISNDAEKIGVDGLLCVAPYYNKTSQIGLIKHFCYIGDRVSTPIIVYNVPSRTGVNIQPETYAELSKHKMIYGVKEANANISAIAKTASLVEPDFAIYSGNDDEITAIMSLGGKGVISVLSNVCPQVAHDICQAYLDGDHIKSRDLQLEYLELCNALFSDVNPIPVKEAMNQMGWNVGPCRMPLCEMSEAGKANMTRVLKKYNLI